MKAKNVVYVVFDEGNFMEKQTLFTIYMPLYVGRGLRNKLDSQPICRIVLKEAEETNEAKRTGIRLEVGKNSVST